MSLTSPIPISSHTEKKQEGQGAGAMDQHPNCTFLSTGCRDISDT